MKVLFFNKFDVKVNVISGLISKKFQILYSLIITYLPWNLWYTKMKCYQKKSCYWYHLPVVMFIKLCFLCIALGCYKHLSQCVGPFIDYKISLSADCRCTCCYVLTETNALLEINTKVKLNRGNSNSTLWNYGDM